MCLSIFHMHRNTSSQFPIHKVLFNWLVCKTVGVFPMIVYKEISSIEQDLEYDIKTLYSISYSLHRHYHSLKIPKKQGGYRILSIPDMPLKCIQKRIADVLLSQIAISPYAKAYRYGGNNIKNATPHINKDIVLKLDIRDFFDNILYSTVKQKAFPKEKYSENIRILLSMLCYYNDALPQGAATSPAISNIIMCEFDNTVGSWCRKRGIAYTRYCDDMTFSGDFNPNEVIKYVRFELRKMGYFLNNKKTIVAHKSNKQIVTGIVVNQKLNISKKYKKDIRQAIYYCKKFGIENHMTSVNINDSTEGYILKLLGKVNYVLSVCPNNIEFIDYRKYLKGLI